MNDIGNLVQRGKSQGYLDYHDLLAYLPTDIVEQDQIDDIMRMLRDMGIEIRMTKAEVVNFMRNNNEQ